MNASAASWAALTPGTRCPAAARSRASAAAAVSLMPDSMTGKPGVCMNAAASGPAVRPPPAEQHPVGHPLPVRRPPGPRSRSASRSSGRARRAGTLPPRQELGRVGRHEPAHPAMVSSRAGYERVVRRTERTRTRRSARICTRCWPRTAATWSSRRPAWPRAADGLVRSARPDRGGTGPGPAPGGLSRPGRTRRSREHPRPGPGRPRVRGVPGAEHGVDPVRAPGPGRVHRPAQPPGPRPRSPAPTSPSRPSRRGTRSTRRSPSRPRARSPGCCRPAP